MGAMFHDRWDHLILPVEGIACPEDFNWPQNYICIN
jgi:hypothetical protein